MTDLINLSKRTLAWSVVGLTALASLLAAAVMAPSAAQSQTAKCPSLSSGDLVQFGDNNAVYILNDNLKRLYFPNSEVYHTWYDDFSGVNKVAMECAQVFSAPSSLPLGVNYRPGSVMVKVPLDNKVYAVTPDNTLRPVANESVAEALYGSDWNEEIRDVADAFWPNYTDRGPEITEEKPHDGMLVSKAGDDAVYKVKDGKLMKVDGDLPAAAADDVQEVSDSVFNSVPMGSGTVTPASVVANPAQAAAAPSDGDGQQQPQAGNATVSLSANTPQSDTVPQDAAHVEFLKFNVKAGNSSVSLDSIDFTRFGLGDSNNFNNVWIEANGVPITDTNSVNSDDTASLNLDGYTVGAGSTVEFTLKADLNSATTDHNDGFKIDSADDIKLSGDGEVKGDFPIKGNKMDYSSYSLASVTINEIGSGGTIDVGQEQVTMGEFDLQYTSNNQNTGLLHYVRFEQNGSGSLDDVKNLALYEDGVKLEGSEAVRDGSFVTFKLPEGKREFNDGDTRRFSIRGDLVDGDDGDDITFKLDATKDIFMEEDALGVSASVTDSLSGTSNSACSAASSNSEMPEWCINAGTFNITRHADNPSNENYSIDTDDITALLTEVNLDDKVDVDGLDVSITTDSTITNGKSSGNSNSSDANDVDNDIDRAELWVDGSKVESVTSITQDSDCNGNDNTIDSASSCGSGENHNELYYDFTNNFSVEDGDQIKLLIDLSSSANTNTYKFTFDNASAGDDFESPEYASDNDTVADADLTGSVTGNKVNIQASSVSVNRTDGFSSGESFIAGVQEDMYFEKLITAGDASSISIDQLKYTTNLQNDTAEGKFTNLFVTVDGEKVSQERDLGTDDAVTFSDVNAEIPANGQAKVALHGTVAPDLANGTSVTFTLKDSGTSLLDVENSDVTFSDVTSAKLNFSQNAELTVAKDSESPTQGWAVADTSDTVNLGIYELTATTGTVGVYEIWVGNSTSSPHNLRTNLDSRFSELQLVHDGNVLDTKSLNSGKVHFVLDKSTEMIMVDKNTTEDITLKGVPTKIDQGSETGQEAHMSLYAVKAQTEGSGNDLTQKFVNEGNIEVNEDSPTASSTSLGEAQAATTTLVRSVPTLQSSSINDNTISNATEDIYAFTVSSHSNYKTGWSRVSLNITGQCSNATPNSDVLDCLGNYTLEDSGGDTISMTANEAHGSSSTLELDISSNPEEVGAGASETYSLEAQLGSGNNFDATADSFSVNIKDNETTFVASSTESTVDTNQSADGTFVWSDNSIAGTNTSDADWFNGFKLDHLDTDSVSKNVNN